MEASVYLSLGLSFLYFSLEICVLNLPSIVPHDDHAVKDSLSWTGGLLDAVTAYRFSASDSGSFLRSGCSIR